MYVDGLMGKCLCTCLPISSLSSGKGDGPPTVTDEEESGSSTSSCDEDGTVPPPPPGPDSASDTASAPSPGPAHHNNIDGELKAMLISGGKERERISDDCWACFRCSLTRRYWPWEGGKGRDL